MGKRARLGLKAYARWCSLLKNQPMAATELAEAEDFFRTGAYRFTSILYSRGLMHIAEWRMEPRKMVIPRFRFGRGEDAEFPKVRPNGSPVNFKPRKIYPDHSVEVSRFANALIALEKVATAAEAAEAAGIELQTMRKVIRELVDCGVVSVVGWDKVPTSSNWVASYQIGGGKNVPKPKPRDHKELNREWRARKRKLDDSRLLMRLWAPMREAA